MVLFLITSCLSILFLSCDKERPQAPLRSNPYDTNSPSYIEPIESMGDTNEVIVNNKENFISVSLPVIRSFNRVDMELVWVEPGTFRMGSHTGIGDEEPQHRVEISRGFYIGKFEVTQLQWSSVMGTMPWLVYGSLGNVQPDGKNPAVYVQWEDAIEYVKKLNEAAGKDIYRLPTEAEWEYAARAGTTTEWSFGNDESRMGYYAWYRDNAWNADKKYAQPVGTKLPNPWGLYDMHGNVWEWCNDWYGNYSEGIQIDPQGPSVGSSRVFRGGDFGSYTFALRSAFRLSGNPRTRYNNVGFRVLRME